MWKILPYPYKGSSVKLHWQREGKEMYLNSISVFNHFKSIVQPHKKIFCFADESKGIASDHVPLELWMAPLSKQSTSLCTCQKPTHYRHKIETVFPCVNTHSKERIHWHFHGWKMERWTISFQPRLTRKPYGKSKEGNKRKMHLLPVYTKIAQRCRDGFVINIHWCLASAPLKAYNWLH